jgi:DNA-binding NtrC family response regulator
VGSARTVRVDVRVIAATNQDLSQAIERREFRADLYDRLSEIVLEVPPLRERHEDVLVLANHFLALHSRRHCIEVQRLTSKAAQTLRSYDWPGNVRELEKTISRAVILAARGYIDAEHLHLLPRHAPSHGGGITPLWAAVPSPRQQIALELAAERGLVCRKDLISRFGVSREAARRDLAALVAAGLLCRTGRGRGTRYQKASMPLD